jgi:hypothetical protein
MHLIEGSQATVLWKDALRHMQEALVILDESDASADIGSHLDLAISRLDDLINGKPPETLVEQLRTEMERLLDVDLSAPAERELAHT